MSFANAFFRFLSTPSARRATGNAPIKTYLDKISIHALREEGDPLLFRGSYLLSISIHALREEGDLLIAGLSTFWSLFLSTPSARRATIRLQPFPLQLWISIHALREEGDRAVCTVQWL